MIKQNVSGTVYGVVLNDHASVRKIGDALDTAQFLSIEIGVKRRAARIQGKSRMRLVTDAGTDADFVIAKGNLAGGRVNRQFASGCIEVARLWNSFGGRWNQRVRAL